MLTLPTTPSPKFFGNTGLNKNQQKNNETTTTLPLSAVVTTTADSSQVKLFVPKAKSMMDARVAKIRAEQGCKIVYIQNLEIGILLR